MMRSRRLFLGSLTVGLLYGLAGCNLPGKENPFAYSAETTPVFKQTAFHGPPVTSFDKDALLSGTGPIDDDAPKEFSETNTGLKYRILRKSNGQKPNSANSVTVDYRGWLDDGTEFDSSYKRGQPISFPLNGVIPGWTEGMQLVGVGGMIELTIPAPLGYGARGAGAAVPPNATLHFIVELHEVK